MQDLKWGRSKSVREKRGGAVNRVSHFEINSPDPEAAERFYSSVFGWDFNAWTGGEQTYWLITTGKDDVGINGGMMQSQERIPPTVNTIDVDSVDDYVAKITDAGGAVAVPKMAIPGVGYQAYCTDPGGVMFGIHQADESAK